MKLTFQRPKIKFHWNQAALAHLFIYITPVAVLVLRVVATETVSLFTEKKKKKKMCQPLFLALHLIKMRGALGGRGCFHRKLGTS